jgi:hypothetical protein
MYESQNVKTLQEPPSGPTLELDRISNLAVLHTTKGKGKIREMDIERDTNVSTAKHQQKKKMVKVKELTPTKKEDAPRHAITISGETLPRTRYLRKSSRVLRNQRRCWSILRDQDGNCLCDHSVLLYDMRL